MMDMMSNGHGSMMGGMWFFSILFWVLIIVGVVFITKWVLERSRDKKEGAGRNKETALDILEKRYAKGEIDQERFEQIRKDIGGPRSPCVPQHQRGHDQKGEHP